MVQEQSDTSSDLGHAPTPVQTSPTRAYFGMTTWRCTEKTTKPDESSIGPYSSWETPDLWLKSEVFDSCGDNRKPSSENRSGSMTPLIKTSPTSSIRGNNSPK